MRFARGLLGIPLPSMPGPKTLCGVGVGNWEFPCSADIALGVLLKSPQGSESSSPVGVCTCAFLLSCSSSVTLPFPWIIGSVAFPRGFPMVWPKRQKSTPQLCPVPYPKQLSAPSSLFPFWLAGSRCVAEFQWFTLMITHPQNKSWTLIDLGGNLHKYL